MCLDQVFAVDVVRRILLQQGQYKLYITVLSIMFSCEHVVLINLSVVSGSKVLSFCIWSDTLARFLAAPAQKSALQLKAAAL